MTTKLVDRFLKYVKFDTQSDELTNLTPSTPGQMVFAKELERELHAMGLSDISLDDNGYLFATLPANTDKAVPTVGFIAHMDTAPDMSGHDVKPRIVKYEGEPIVLSEEPRIVLDPVQFPEMNDYKGQDFIVTSGDTLLGADDKAGIAEILTAIEWLQEHPEVKHGNIRVASTPTRKSVWAPTTLMWRSSVVTGPTPWTVVPWASWSMRTSTPPAPRLPSRA